MIANDIQNKPKTFAFFIKVIFPALLLVPSLFLIGIFFPPPVENYNYYVLGVSGFYMLIFIPYYYFTRINYIVVSGDHLFIKQKIDLLKNKWQKFELNSIKSIEFEQASRKRRLMLIQINNKKIKLYLNWVQSPKTVVTYFFINFINLIKNSRTSIKEFMDSL